MSITLSQEVLERLKTLARDEDGIPYVPKPGVTGHEDIWDNAYADGIFDGQLMLAREILTALGVDWT